MFNNKTSDGGSRSRRRIATIFAGAVVLPVAVGVTTPGLASAAPPPCPPTADFGSAQVAAGTGCAVDISIPGVDTTGVNDTLTGLLTAPAPNGPNAGDIAAGSAAVGSLAVAGVFVGPYIAAVPLAISVDLNQMLTGDPNGSVTS